MTKTSRRTRAKNAAKKLKEGNTKATHRVRTKLRFYRKKTRITKSRPTTLNSLKSEIRKRNNNGIDYYSILLQPVTSDKNLQQMEKNNTITFMVHPKAKKCQIKEAFEKLYGSKVRKVNTLNQVGKGKKAYIRLMNDNEALNTGTKIGII